MSKKSATAQLFSVNKSRLLIRWLIFTHTLAAFAGLANGLPWVYKIIAVLLVLCSLFIYLRRYHYQFQPYQLKYNEDASWSVAFRNNEFQTVQLLPTSVITAWLIVLHFRLQSGKFQSLVIFNDALNSQNYRSLIVTLKIAGLNGNNDSV